MLRQTNNEKGFKCIHVDGLAPANLKKLIKELTELDRAANLGNENNKHKKFDKNERYYVNYIGTDGIAYGGGFFAYIGATVTTDSNGKEIRTPAYMRIKNVYNGQIFSVQLNKIKELWYLKPTPNLKLNTTSITQGGTTLVIKSS